MTPVTRARRAGPAVIKGTLYAQGKIPSPAARLPLLPARQDTVHAAVARP
jgi:4-hydroxy-tetrahydrodipicolinate synthase